MQFSSVSAGLFARCVGFVHDVHNIMRQRNTVPYSHSDTTEARRQAVPTLVRDAHVQHAQVSNCLQCCWPVVQFWIMLENVWFWRADAHSTRDTPDVAQYSVPEFQREQDLQYAALHVLSNRRW